MSHECPTNVPRTSSGAFNPLDDLDAAYDTAAVRARIIGLLGFYSDCERNPALAAAAVEMARRSFGAYLAMFAWTADPKDSVFKIKPFSPLPVYRELADWADEREPDGTWTRPIIAIDKSRQLMMSWWAILRMGWIAERSHLAEIPVISKREEDAVRILRRLEIVHEHYPAFYRRAMGLDALPAQFKRAHVVYPASRSVIEALPEEGEKVRSMVPPAWLADEAAFQPNFERNFGALKGTSDARTQGIAISTAAPSFFQLLMEDAVDGRRGVRRVEVPRTMSASVNGLAVYDREFWVNEVNRVHCARVYYLADPARRGAEWLAEAKRGMGISAFNREQLISYEARGGQPVFPMLNRDAHLMRVDPRVVKTARGWGIVVPGYDPGLTGSDAVREVTLIRAMDHGTRGWMACVWLAVTMDEDRDVVVYRAYRRTGWGVGANCEAIAGLSGDEVYQFDVLDAYDRTPETLQQTLTLYQGWRGVDGRMPFRRVSGALKGRHSRAEGVDMIGSLLHSTLAVVLPESGYWGEFGYDAGHVASFREHSSLFIAPSAVALFEELLAARYDERAGGDPGMNQPETTLDMQDDLTDALRYGLRAGWHLVRTRRFFDAHAKNAC